MDINSDSSVALRTGVEGSVTSRLLDLDGRRVSSFSIDGSIGALTEADGFTITNACTIAREQRMPLVGFVESSGAAVREGITAAHGWGRAAQALVKCSGLVPTLLIATGPLVAGPALMLGIADLTIVVSDAHAFLSGPAMVEQFTGLPIEIADLGGASIHASRSGVAAALAADRDGALDMAAEFLSYLPSSNNGLPPHRDSGDAPTRSCPELHNIVPTSATGSYDVRDVVRAIADDEIFVEVRAAWAGNLVTGFANVDGHAVGIVANQPQNLAGTLDIAASQKGARFVTMCDAFNVPLLTFVDTPGFQPGKDLEWRGMIRHGAQLAFAYARATVPRVSITLRKSYGGAYIVMDSKTMGNDLALAWPSAEIAVMGAKGAVEILHRRSSVEERAELEADYEARLLNPYRAAERGSVDMVIDPADTRTIVADALALLATKREKLPRRRHSNTPL